MIKLLELILIPIPNPNYYQQVLDQSNGLSISQRQYYNKIIQSVKRQGNKATERQYNLLTRMKEGDYTYHPKN
jgi:uncharacterized protein YjdB